MHPSLHDPEPTRVIELFCEISKIPRGSKKEKQVSDYIAAFARDLGLETYQDDMHNLIVYKDASPGYAGAPVTVLQSHLDMVWDKDKCVDFNFKTDHIKVIRDGKYIRAEGTTLGADNGIGMAYMMAIMEAKDLKHPPLELVFTTDKEAGMSGVENLDLSRIEGRLFINTDCYSIVMGCAGYQIMYLDVPKILRLADTEKTTYAISIEGLLGGHCGEDAVKERGNAMVLLGRIVHDFVSRFDMDIVSFDGGIISGAIPRYASCIVMLNKARLSAVRAALSNWGVVFRRELSVSDPGVKVIIVKVQQAKEVLSVVTQATFLDLMLLAPSGAQTRSMKFPYIPETSVNLGIVSTYESKIRVTATILSLIDSKRKNIVKKISLLCSLLGIIYSLGDSKPAWEYDEKSRVAKLIDNIHYRKYGKPAKMLCTHATTEGVVISKAIPGVDLVCVGPQILDAHTPKERVEIESIRREWEQLITLLEELINY